MHNQELRTRQTIASIVTPRGEGGIGKIIVSGADALGIVNKVFRCKGIADLHSAGSQRLYYGVIHDGGRRIDEVIINVLKRGDSLTGEDVVEVNCHGGVRVLAMVYELLLSNGAAGAGWDALLLQSLENGTLDFIQKEALQEVVNARTRLGVKALLDQYAGALSGSLRQGLEVLERIGQASDKSDIYPSRDADISFLINLMESLLKTSPLGIALTTPQVFVILGKPNVGKSTLINAILGEERMLVHHEPGTTRDYVSEYISIQGVPFEFVDTAGIRNSDDVLETMGMELTQEQLQRADKIVVVFDNSRHFDDEDEGVLRMVRPLAMAKKAIVVPVANKCDLPAKLDWARIESALGQPLCGISAGNGEGLDILNGRFVQGFDTVYKPMRPIVFRERQRVFLEEADAIVKKVCESARLFSLETVEALKRNFLACLNGQNPPQKMS